MDNKNSDVAVKVETPTTIESKDIEVIQSLIHTNLLVPYYLIDLVYSRASCDHYRSEVVS